MLQGLQGLKPPLRVCARVHTRSRARSFLTLQTLQTLHPAALMADHLVTTRATPTTCRRCEGQLLVGLAEGITARVDAEPLTGRAGELAALTEGRITYTRFRNGELVERTPGRITDPFLLLRGPIHASHQCPGKPQGELF